MGANEPKQPQAVAASVGGSASQQLHVKAVPTCRWTHGEKVDGIAYYTVAGQDKVTLSFSDKFIVYSVDEQSAEQQSCMMMHIITGFCVQQKYNRHFVLDDEEKEVRIYKWPLDLEKSSFRQHTKSPVLFTITSAPEFYFYAYLNSEEKIVIVCVGTSRLPPFKVWECQTGLTRHRAMNAMATGADSTQPWVVISNACGFTAKNKLHETALKCVCGAGIRWELSFKDFDQKATTFDLRSIDNDDTNFFVLNSKTNCITVVSGFNGSVLTKVDVTLKKPMCLSFNKVQRKLAVVENSETITLFDVHYLDGGNLHVPPVSVVQPSFTLKYNYCL